MGRGWGGQTFFAGGVEVEAFKEVIHGCGWTGPLLGQIIKVPALRCTRHGVEKRCGVVRAPGRERAALGELVAGRDLVTRGGWSDAGRWSCHNQDWNQNIGMRQRLFSRSPHCCWSIYAFCALLSLGSVVTIIVIALRVQLRLHTRDFEYSNY